MLMPKRVKRRRVHRGRMTGKATRGNKVTYGQFGLQALDPGWITSNRLKPPRVAMTRYIKEAEMYALRFFPDKLTMVRPAETRWERKGLPRVLGSCCKARQNSLRAGRRVRRNCQRSISTGSAQASGENQVCD